MQHLRSADRILVLGNDGIVLEQGTFTELNASNGYVRHLIIEEKQTKRASVDEPPMIRDKPEAQARVAGLDLLRNDKARQTGDTAVYKYYYRSVGWKRMVPWVMVGIVGVFCEKFPGRPILPSRTLNRLLITLSHLAAILDRSCWCRHRSVPDNILCFGSVRRQSFCPLRVVGLESNAFVQS